MKKLKAILSFVFTLGIMCLGFSFASKNFGLYNAFAYSSQIVLENSTFDMAGGTISNAIGDNGGAVYVGDGATFTMTGGKIKNCSATNGGAVYVANGGVFNFDGGTIENCSADLGYAIYVQAGGTLNYENNENGFSGCGEDEDLHIYAEEGAIVIAPGVNINIFVDNSSEPVRTIKKAGDSYTIDEAEMPLDYESCCGYFYDSKLSQCTNGVVDLTKAKNGDLSVIKTTVNSGKNINIYTKTASPSSFFTFRENTKTGTYDIIASSSSIEGDLVFPKEYNNVQTSIWDYLGNNPAAGAFYNCTKITSITFQDGLQRVGQFGLYNCSKAAGDLIIPDSVTSIGKHAFYQCKSFTGSLVIPESVTSIDAGAFYDCTGLSGDLFIHSGITSIAESAFGRMSCNFSSITVDANNEYYDSRNNCNAIVEKASLKLIAGCNYSNLSVLEEMQQIGDSSFYNCVGLTGSITLGANVTRIGSSAFSECSGLSGNLVIPDSVTEIGSSAFYKCSGLTGTLTLSKNISIIPYYGFAYCGFSGALTIPNNVITIDQLAFYHCSGFNGKLTLSSGLTTIGFRAFAYCGFTGSLTIPDSVTTINSYAFDDCKGFTGTLTLPKYITTIAENAFAYCNFTGELVIPDGVTTIESHAFCGCKKLTGLKIPNSVTSIGQYAFYNCYKLSGTIILPDSVTDIGYVAFYYCTELDGLYIPSSVTTITVSTLSNSPVWGCTSTMKLYCEAPSKPDGWGQYWNYYNSSSQLETIWGCSLDSNGNIVIPTSINFYVDGTYHSSITKAGTSYTVQESDMPLQYENCCGYFYDEILMTTIKNNTIDLSNGDVNLYTRTANCPSDYFTYNLDSITNTYWINPKRSAHSGGANFISKTKRMTVTATNHYVIPKEYLGLPIVEVKGDGQIQVNLPTYSSVTLCDNITSIGDYAFYSCSLLSGRLIIPNSVTSIGYSAFNSCSGLTSVIIGNSVTSIGDNAFQYCSGLTGELIIPDSVTSIGHRAFYSCSGLTSVYIPNSVTTISASSHSYAPFYNCSSSLVIYTDVVNASSIPSGWGTYWNYYASGKTLTVRYGYSLTQYKAEVGLTFAPSGGGEAQKDEDIEISQNMLLQCLTETTVDAIIEKRGCVVLQKKEIKIA